MVEIEQSKIYNNDMTKLPDSKLDVKLIAFDLDDTLLTSETKISPKTVEAIRACAKNGIYIVLCSGRPESGILPHVRTLDIAGMQTGRFIIAINGASIIDLHTRQPLRSMKLDGATLKEVHGFAAEHSMGCHVAKGDTIHADSDTEWARKDSILCKMNFTVEKDFDEFLEQGFEKMLVPAPEQQVAAILPEMKKHFEGKADIFISKPFFIEVMPTGVGKGPSIMYLADYLGIDKNQTMAFGDSFNDESMLKAVNYSVCMKNGAEQMKNISKFVTEYSNNEDGIADFLEKWVL